MVKVAIAQAHLQVGDVPANILKTINLIDQVSSLGAQVVVLPELANSGYVYHDKQELIKSLENTDVLKLWQQKSKQHKNIIVAGFAQVEGDKVYNRSVILDSGEILDIYTKVHLWDKEKNIFTPGNRAPKVINSSIGNISTLICYDLEFPEFVSIPAIANAELIAVPTNWPKGFYNRPKNEKYPMELIKAMATAATNKVWLAICDRSGEERGIEWLESSCLIDPDGWPVAVSGPGEGFVIHELDLSLARDKTISGNNHIFEDRRKDVYKQCELN